MVTYAAPADRFLLPAWAGGFRVVPLDLPDLAMAPLCPCRRCGFTAPVNEAGRCGKCSTAKESTT